MIGWAVFAAYMLASALTGRALLRLIMTRPVCSACREGWFAGQCFAPHSFGPKPRWVPLGELTDRPLGIATLAALAGLAWPFTALVALTMHAPRTPGELARINDEQAARIAELERELGVRP